MINPNDLYAFIGRKIARRRKELRLTQEEVSSKVLLRRTSLCNIETGRQAAPIDRLYAIAEALDISPKDLLPDPGQSLVDQEELIQDALEAAKNLSPDAVKELIQRLAEEGDRL